MSPTTAVRNQLRRPPDGITVGRGGAVPQRGAGIAALYVAIALLAAIPYFLLVVDHPGATTAADTEVAR